MMKLLILAAIGNRGPGFLIFLLALVFIIGFDKVVKLIVYITDKLEERKKRRKENNE